MCPTFSCRAVRRLACGRMAEEEAQRLALLSVSNERFCITTAINYANGLPHMGHAYEAVSADVLARYHRAFGRQVLFMTGADEHGQKIADAAAQRGVTPIELCDHFVTKFQVRLQLFLPTTEGPVRLTALGAIHPRAHAAGAQCASKYQLRRVQSHNLAEAQGLVPAGVPEGSGSWRHLPRLLRRLVRALVSSRIRKIHVLTM